MKWKAKNKPENKTATIKATQGGESLHMDLSGPSPLPRGRSEYWVKIKVEFTGKSTASWH
jgi:ribosomal protein S10